MRKSLLYFTVSGAIGGAIGFVLMELVNLAAAGAPAEESPSLVANGWLFAAFGVAVGAALGATAGIYFRQRPLLLNGMVAGAVLGLAGGFVGGLFGQWIFNRIPVEYVSSTTGDIAVVLDSSGSMSAHLFGGGNDPDGKRRTASKELIRNLSSDDRIAVVDFDDQGKLLFPLTYLATDQVRQEAEAAVDSVDDAGGTNLDAGLSVAIAELMRAKEPDRPQSILFLTDGGGSYSDATGSSARKAGIAINTVGLGSGADGSTLKRIAKKTGGKYYAVAEASGLVSTFEKIRVERPGSMAVQRENQGRTGEKLKTKPVWLWFARLASWGAMGLLLGLGQGLRDNSWEDLKSCSLGGCLGGLIGGAVIEGFQIGVAESGMSSRLLAVVIVGALIGGTLRLIKNASEASMAAARIEKKPIVGGLAVGGGKKGTRLGAW